MIWWTMKRLTQLANTAGPLLDNDGSLFGSEAATPTQNTSSLSAWFAVATSLKVIVLFSKAHKANQPGRVQFGQPTCSKIGEMRKTRKQTSSSQSSDHSHDSPWWPKIRTPYLSHFIKKNRCQDCVNIQVISCIVLWQV